VKEAGTATNVPSPLAVKERGIPECEVEP